jgi:predicted transcriptional regulator
MKKSVDSQLSRRERQIMNLVYQLGEASVADIAERMPEGPGYDSIRVTLGILARKGFVRHRRKQRRYIYSPTVPRTEASRSAMRDLLRTFFAGSTSKAVLAMLDMSSSKLTKKDLDRIAEWVEKEKRS